MTTPLDRSIFLTWFKGWISPDASRDDVAIQRNAAWEAWQAALAARDQEQQGDLTGAPSRDTAACLTVGLALSQEPKYTVDGKHIVNRASGEAIPNDEPVFVFRARDVHAREALEAYACVLTPGHHRDAVTQRIADFANFSYAHPERMKEPDTAETQRSQETQGPDLNESRPLTLEGAAPLSDEQIEALMLKEVGSWDLLRHGIRIYNFARAIEKAHGIGHQAKSPSTFPDAAVDWSGWVATTERLPKPYETVFLDCNVSGYITADGEWMRHDTGEGAAGVEHWLEIPSPMQKRSGEVRSDSTDKSAVDLPPLPEPFAEMDDRGFGLGVYTTSDPLLYLVRGSVLPFAGTAFYTSDQMREYAAMARSGTANASRQDESKES